MTTQRYTVEDAAWSLVERGRAASYESARADQDGPLPTNTTYGVATSSCALAAHPTNDLSCQQRSVD
jgi:hypothetical protein